MDFWHDFFILLGRIGIGLLFVWQATTRIRQWHGTKAYIETKNVPIIPFYLPVAIAVQILCGLSLLIGWQVRFAAGILALFTIVSTILFHDFWNLEEPEKTWEKTLFMKDVAVLGGLFILIAIGSGGLSI